MWNPFKKTRLEETRPAPQPPGRPQSPPREPAPLPPENPAAEVVPPYRVWSEAVQAAGVRANKPCSAAQIEAFERELGAELTPELRQLYLMHDGMQESDDGKYRLLSLQEVRKMGEYAHANFTWFPSLANDDWKLRTFFSYDNMDNTNAAVYLEGPLRGCVAEWGGGLAPNLPTYRSVNQLLFRAANAVVQDQEIYQYEPPWSDYPAGPSPSPQALSHDRQLAAALRELLDAVPPASEEDEEGCNLTNRGYLESCIIYVTPMEDVGELRPYLASSDRYVLENLTESLKHRNLDAWIGDEDERREWMRGLSLLVRRGYGNATGYAMEVLGQFRTIGARRYIRYALDHCHPNYSSKWLNQYFQRHAEVRELDDERQEYRIVGSSDWHPVGSKYGEPGEP